MTRIEAGQQSTDQMKQLKKEVVSEVKKGKKGSHKVLTCLVVAGVAFLLVVLYAAFLLAKSGLVRVPVLTDAFYEPPAPYRIVTPGTPIEDDISETFSEIVRERIEEGGGDIKDRNISIPLTEEAFTASIRAASDEVGGEYLDTKNVQVVLMPEFGYEIFIPFPESKQKTALTIYTTIKFDEQGVLQANISKVKIGQMRIPNFIAKSAFKPALDLASRKFVSEVGRYVKVISSEVFDGYVLLHCELIVEVLQINN